MVDSTLDSFVKALRERKLVIVHFFSKEDGEVNTFSDSLLSHF